MSDDSRLRAARLLARSRFAMPIAEVRNHIRERRETLRTAPAPVAEPSFAPTPMPILDDPIGFAAEFWNKQAARPKSPKPQTPGRRPKTADTKPEAGRFRVIDGGDNPPGDDTDRR